MEEVQKLLEQLFREQGTLMSIEVRSSSTGELEGIVIATPRAMAALEEGQK